MNSGLKALLWIVGILAIVTLLWVTGILPAIIAWLVWRGIY